jgi:hypothetical protein
MANLVLRAYLARYCTRLVSKNVQWPQDDELSHIRWPIGKKKAGTLMLCNDSSPQDEQHVRNGRRSLRGNARCNRKRLPLERDGPRPVRQGSGPLLASHSADPA